MGNVDDLFRMYTVKVNDGTGCLFQPATSKFTYVLTAKHCLEGANKKELEKKDIKVKREIDLKKFKTLNVLNVYRHKDKDAAILEVDYIGDDIKLYYTTCKRPEKVVFCGYPKRREEVELETDLVNCHVNRLVSRTVIEITPDSPPYTNEHNADEILEGFSGSGVFKEVGDDILLVGILSRFSDDMAAFGRILILPITDFSDITKTKRLPALRPNHLSSFEGYKNDICKGYDVKLKAAKQKIEDFADVVIGKKVTPMLIIEQFQEKLCVPNNKDWLNDRALWSGWFELLTYMTLVEEKIESDELDFLDKLLKNKCIFYNNNEEDWYSLLRMILEQNPGGLKNIEHVITIQKSKDFKTNTKVRSNAIVTQIGRPSISMSGSGPGIDGSRKPNDYIFIHPQEFKEKIKDNRRNLIGLDPEDDKKIIQELRNSIKKAFSDD